MSTVKQKISKSGVISYQIRCYAGYDVNGKQIEKTMTWKPDPTLSKKALEKALQRQIVLFEEKVNKGNIFDSSTTFAKYSVTWLENNAPPQLAPKTYERYQEMLTTVNQAIGHIRLEKLQSQHILFFYKNLRESGLKKKGSYAVTSTLNEAIKKRKVKKVELARLTALSEKTIYEATAGRHISVESANKIAEALGLKVNDLFKVTYGNEGFSDRTILHHHRLISVILAQATRDRLIPFNIADRNYTKAPRVSRKESVYLEDYEAEEVMSVLAMEPIKWRTAIMLLIYSGMRRGELMGLEWQDIDFENQVIHIRRTSQYVKALGIITKDTKTYSSVRTIMLPPEAFVVLEEYKFWWLNTQRNMGDRWQYQIIVFFARTFCNEMQCKSVTPQMIFTC